MTDLANRLDDLRARAGWFNAKRRSDGQLYCLLADCLAICETAHNNPNAIKAAYLARPLATGKSRTYFETATDIYTIVGRWVFDAEKGRVGAWRYGTTLREAAKRGIAAGELASWLAGNGGVNALFRRRPVVARTAKTKTLHLTSQVTVPKEGPFTMILSRTGDGWFDVLEVILK